MKLFNTLIAKSLPIIPKAIVRYISNRYIAGEQLSDAIRRVKELNNEGFSATLDVLGECITKKEQATQNAKEYIEVLYAINHHKIDANISIKPSSMGLLLDTNFCYETMKSIVEVADKFKIFVRIDMEDVECTDKEFDLLRKLKKDFPDIGIVVQSYLKRTRKDIDHLIKENINCRLCKGIYIEDEKHIIKNANDDRLAINPFFLDDLKQFLDNKNSVAIATHDQKLVYAAYDLIESTNADKEDYEFQMLLGVRNGLRDSIKEKGHKMRIYIPFGKDWYAYSVRRLNENPSIAAYVFKAMLFGD